MRPRTITAAVLGSIFLAGAALAQAGGPFRGEAGGGVSETTRPSAIRPDNFAAFLANFSDPDFSSAIGGIDSALNFHVVKLSDLENVDAGRLGEAILSHSAKLIGLHTVLASNNKAATALKAKGVSAEQVVWIAGGGEREMTLYVLDL